MGSGLTTELAVDQDEEATRVYAANHRARAISTESVANLVDFRVRGEGVNAGFSYQPELISSHDVPSTMSVDMVMAGPPCQGHSNLNNHTRRDDRRNALYLTVPAFAVATGARVAIIENVPSVVHDASQVVESTTRLFEDAGYRVTTGVLSAGDMGWVQQRRRHFLVARLDRAPIRIADVGELLRDSTSRSAWWAIGDLEDHNSDSVLDQVTELSEENQSRVDWLFDNNEYDLALSERPKSHRDGTSYTSVYGRMKKDEPAQTITTGFMSPGRGRYVHPTRRRVMTAREAARPVPMPLGYAAALSALGSGPLS
jgi:DNA (cytosine-5)-methyltransferase 1